MFVSAEVSSFHLGDCCCRNVVILVGVDVKMILLGRVRRGCEDPRRVMVAIARHRKGQA